MRILIIEDETEIAEMVAFALKRAGIDSVHALTAREGLAQLDATINAVILDVGLPDMNGLDVLKELRQSSDLPVLMLTAQNEEIDRVLGLELGADDYIGKPFSPRELVARVKAVLKRSQGHETMPLMPNVSIGNYVYDEERQVVTCCGQALPLTVAELNLMRHFMQQPHRVFSRQQLLAAAFSNNHPSDERTMDSHIKSLRAKIRASGAENPLATHRGIGYSFEP